MPSNNKTLLYVQFAVLLITAIWIHAPAAPTWIWDDELLIAANSELGALDKIFRLWTEDLWSGAPGEHVHSWYRPMAVFSFWVDQFFFPDNPLAAKWHSVLWHGAALVLTERVMNIWISNPHARLIGLSVLATHPCTLELTQFVSARNDSMAAVGCLSCFLLATQQRYFLVFCAALFALLSKESALLSLGLFGFYWMLKQESPKLLGAVAGATFIWTALRLKAALHRAPTPELVWTAPLHYHGSLTAPRSAPWRFPQQISRSMPPPSSPSCSWGDFFTKLPESAGSQPVLLLLSYCSLWWERVSLMGFLIGTSTCH